MTIVTRITRLLEIKTPIISAPMAGASGGAVAAQTHVGGGFGFLAAGYETPEKFIGEIEIARSQLNASPTAILPIGIGFLGWQLEKSPSRAKEMISIALDNHVQAIWLSFGQDLGQFVRYIREYEQTLKREQRVYIFIQVSSPEDADKAVHQWNADVLVVQGTEAGGHGSSKALPLITLLPLILATVPDGTPVVAAGGMATGAQIAAALTLGAAGVVVGTRFLLSPESLYNTSQKQALVVADSRSSVRTMAFDYARNTLGWPADIDGRGLRNHTVDDFEKGDDLEVIRQKFCEGVQKNDPERMLVWAGTSVGLMHEEKPVKDIVEELHKDCIGYIQRAAAMLTHS
ncbi:hypothetical protein AX17_007245 [Amanita inopinata Kibby_2008]|nr:hypothetical protein AX17_007245 [Amanita inopinata Kibby_2008]